VRRLYRVGFRRACSTLPPQIRACEREDRAIPALDKKTKLRPSNIYPVASGLESDALSDYMLNLKKKIFDNISGEVSRA
jgi:hypothetical protein